MAKCVKQKIKINLRSFEVFTNFRAVNSKSDEKKEQFYDGSYRKAVKVGHDIEDFQEYRMNHYDCFIVYFILFLYEIMI